MAIGAGVSIGATDIASRADDKPILMGRNWLKEATAEWWNEEGTFLDGDAEESATG